MQLDFSRWYRWSERGNFGSNIKYPASYVIAITPDDISDKPFSFRPEVVYVGMTRSQGGLKDRLWAFDDAISRKRWHGGAERVLYKDQDYATLCAKLYVAMWHKECDPKRQDPHDLRSTGEVVPSMAAARLSAAWPRCNRTFSDSK